MTRAGAPGWFGCGSSLLRGGAVLTSVNLRGAVPEFAAPFVDLNQTAKDFVRGHVGDSCNAHAARVLFFARNFGLSVPQTWLRIIPKT